MEGPGVGFQPGGAAPGVGAMDSSPCPIGELSQTLMWGGSSWGRRGASEAPTSSFAQCPEGLAGPAPSSVEMDTR